MSGERCLLWDHDGVLVDTEPWYFEATRAALADAGIRLTRSRYLELMADGAGYFGAARDAGMSEADIAALRADRDERYQQHLRSQPIEIPGIQGVLEHLAASHRMAIVTTSKRRDFDLIHRNRDIVRYFELVLTREDYAVSKPSPEPYLCALGQLGATPDRTFVIEDSARGLRSAVAAGLRCIVVRSEFTRTQDFTGAWRMVEEIRDLPALIESARH